MKEVKSRNSKASKLTVERLRQFDGLSNLSDLEAKQIIESPDQLSRTFCLLVKKLRFILMNKSNAFQLLAKRKTTDSSRQVRENAVI
jgi:hypothetical protein